MMLSSKSTIAHLTVIPAPLYVGSCHYSEDLDLLLKQSRHLKGRTVHTTAALAPKLQDILGVHSIAVDPVQDPSAYESSSSHTNASSSGSRVIGGLLESTLSRCRAVKTDAEVACLLHANEASGRAHEAMWRACRPGGQLLRGGRPLSLPLEPPSP